MDAARRSKADDCEASWHINKDLLVLSALAYSTGFSQFMLLCGILHVSAKHSILIASEFNRTPMRHVLSRGSDAWATRTGTSVVHLAYRIHGLVIILAFNQGIKDEMVRIDEWMLLIP